MQAVYIYPTAAPRTMMPPVATVAPSCAAALRALLGSAQKTIVFVGVATCRGRLDTVVKYLDSNSLAGLA